MMTSALISTPNLINGLFKLVGAAFTWRNAWQLRTDREIRGVYWPTSLFFAAWGCGTWSITLRLASGPVSPAASFWSQETSLG